MAIDFVVFRELVGLAARFAPGGRGLMLGRQRFPMKPTLRPFYQEVLSAAGFDGEIEDYQQEDGYSETLFRKLGLCEIETMDFSDFEGAHVLHDLNQPVDEVLHKKYDFIFDGGTTEHVFNVPVAFENLFNLLKTSGRLVSVNGFNNWPCHGMYQFGPELVWTFWKRKCGCEVHGCKAISKPRIRQQPVDMPDPGLKGKRLKFPDSMWKGKVHLYFEVERLATSTITENALQSDYVRRWEGAASMGAQA